MFLDRLLGRRSASVDGIRFIITFDEPFIGLVYQDGARVERILHALDPERIGEILADLRATPELERHPFVAAVRDALRGEIHDAFEQWYAWLQAGDDAPALSVAYYCANKLSFRGTENAGAVLLRRLTVTDDDPDSERAVAFRHRTATGRLDARGTENPRAIALEKLWMTFHDFTWKSPMRFAVLEAIAIAFSKYYGSLSNYERALYFVDVASREPRASIHLKTTRQVLHMRKENQLVHPRLEKFVGPDNGYLKDFVCEMPFKRFDIVETGEINLCCGHWLPRAIGTVDDADLEVTLNSGTAQAIRRSMIDGTYKYCNHLECVQMSQDAITRRDKVQDPQVLRAMASGDFRVDRVDNMLFAYDRSCNLACPSCRRERIIEKPSENEAKARTMEVKLKPLISRLRHLEINVAGELFVSKPSRQILAMISPESCPDLTVDLISNGMLFTPAEWEKFPGIHGKVGGVRISIDAARPATFERLRRFGVHDVLLKNLEFLSRLRRSGEIGSLSFSFTYQLENFREMEEFVAFGRAHGVDKVIFEPLQNVGAFTDDEYRARAVHKSDHPLYPVFVEMIRRPVFRTAGIQHDFSSYDYGAFGPSGPAAFREFAPESFTDGLEGLIAVPGPGGTEFRALPINGRHRVIMQDDATLHGSYRFVAEIRPIHTAYVGIELHSLALADYGRILIDVAANAVAREHSVLTCIADMDVSKTPDGSYSLSFIFAVSEPSAITVNIYLANPEAEVLWPGDERARFTVSSIVAARIDSAAISGGSASAQARSD
jgi:hypothetical protein